jgi:hypothetical protein
MPYLLTPPNLELKNACSDLSVSVIDLGVSEPVSASYCLIAVVEAM